MSVGYRILREPTPTHYLGMYGLGDCLFERGFIRNLPGSYLTTPWPELFSDLDVKCVRPSTSLRTQRKNIRASGYRWHFATRCARTVRISYSPADLANGSIVTAMMAHFGVEPTFDLPDFGPSPIRCNKPVAIVRPVTVRREWMNPARSPKP